MKNRSFQKPFLLKNRQVQFYKDNGYLHIANVFTKDDIDIIKKDMDDFAKGHFTSKLDAHFYKNIKRLHRGKRLCDIGDSVLGDRAIPIGSYLTYFKPKNPLELGSTWHQDNYAGKTPNGNNYINIAVAIDNADKSNGALKVVPGSHKLGELKCNPKINFKSDKNGRLVQINPIGNNCEVPNNLKTVQLKYNSGDILIINGLTVHKADKNFHPEKWRRKIYFVYLKNGEAFWPGWTAKRELLNRYDSGDYIQ